MVGLKIVEEVSLTCIQIAKQTIDSYRRNREDIKKILEKDYVTKKRTEIDLKNFSLLNKFLKKIKEIY